MEIVDLVYFSSGKCHCRVLHKIPHGCGVLDIFSALSRFPHSSAKAQLRMLPVEFRMEPAEFGTMWKKNGESTK